jgi:hypothetical protein
MHAQQNEFKIIYIFTNTNWYIDVFFVYLKNFLQEMNLKALCQGEILLFLYVFTFL